MAKDINQLVKSLVDKATDEKNPHAQALGRLGGLVGGHARKAKLTPERRKEIAEKAAAARWKK